MAFKTRRMAHFKSQLIHHSDRGGQYVSDEYVKLLTEAEIQISMCNQVYENAHVERINGTIKNQYLIHRNITNYEQLVKELDRSVIIYNTKRPHSSLGNLTPCAFEQHIKELDESKRPNLTIWTDNSIKFTNPNQCIMQF